MAGSIIVSDMDGTLSTAETWRGVHAWISAHHPSPAARRFVAVRLPMILAARVGLYDKEAFRARWLLEHATLLAGMAADALPGMGDWIVDRHLWPARRQVAEAVEHRGFDETPDQGVGRVPDPSSGAYQPVADAFAARIGADVALATPMEVLDGVVTGRLAAPTQSGVQKAAAVLAYAGDREIIAAFGDTAADAPLLKLARRAVAVAPDGALRRTAVEHGWEIVEASSQATGGPEVVRSYVPASSMRMRLLMRPFDS